MTRWLTETCGQCAGHGVVSDYGNGEDFYGAKDCHGCGGQGFYSVSDGNRLALYPGGTFLGTWPGRFAHLSEQAVSE